MAGSLHGGSEEGGGGIYSVGNLLRATTWRIRFPDGVIEVGMVPSSWNNFLQPLLRFAVVRSNHGEGLVRINLSSKLMSISFESDRLGSVSLFHRWQKRGRRKTQEERRRLCSFQPTGMLIAVFWALVLSLLAERMPVRPSI